MLVSCKISWKLTKQEKQITKQGHRILSNMICATILRLVSIMSLAWVPHLYKFVLSIFTIHDVVLWHVIYSFILKNIFINLYFHDVISYNIIVTLYRIDRKYSSRTSLYQLHEWSVPVHVIGIVLFRATPTRTSTLPT